MQPDERFRAILDEMEIDKPELPTAEVIWSAFKVYGREIFGGEGVALLFQVGRWNASSGGDFYFDPVCQFEVADEDSEYSHYEQLHCEMTAGYSHELSGINETLWSFDYPSADAFFDVVEQLPGFRAAISNRYKSVDIYYEEC